MAAKSGTVPNFFRVSVAFDVIENDRLGMLANVVHAVLVKSIAGLFNTRHQPPQEPAMNRISSLRFVPTGMLLVAAFTRAQAADWPMYRADAARGGYTAETLGENLSLSWSFQPKHAPQPAWPRSNRMPFDRASHVAVASGKVYFGSSVTGQIHAIDVTAGKLLWTFDTAGPIRFAPAVWRDRVLVASDDGCLYALAAADGKLLWKKRGGPDDAWRLGNERMISKWPARGGPAVVGDLVYFAAGLWPTDGIYLYALQAETGEVVWANEDSGDIDMPQPHGGANATSGVSAQGYLVVSGGKLFVPTGRAVPAAFDAATGKFQYFHLQKNGHKGGTPTMAVGGAFFNSGLAFDTATGRAGATVGDGPLAATPDGLVRGSAKQVASYQWAEISKPDRRGAMVKSRGLRAGGLAEGVDSSAAVIVAGKTIVCGGQQSVSIVDRKTNTTMWTAPTDGVVYGLAVSDGRLLASTDRGTIYCFDSRGVKPPVVVKAPANDTPYAGNVSAENIAAAAEEIVKLSGRTNGYCLDIGCGDGGLSLELARRTKLHVVAVDDDVQQVALARKRLAAVGALGSRVTVIHAPLDRTGLPNYFADLVVSRRMLDGTSGKTREREWKRLQRPFGGVALLGPAGALVKTERGPLANAGSWTHQYSNAANTLCSTDERIKGPLGMLWFRDVDVKMAQRHGRAPAPLFSAGRLISQGLDELVCVDAYNGRVIWKYPLPGILAPYDGDELMGTAGTGSPLCMADGCVYVRHEDHCLRIDAATGQLLNKFIAPKQGDGESAEWGYLAADGGLLFGSIADREHVVTYRYINRGGDMDKLLTESKTLFALDGKTGDQKWRYDAEYSIRHNAIAIADGTVYLIDRPLAMFDRIRSGRSSVQGHPTGTLVALDAANGKLKWKKTEQIFGTMLAASTEHDVLLMSYQPTRFRLASEVGGRLAAFATVDGKRHWDKPAKYASRPMINGNTIYAEGGAWDLLTGAERPFNFRRSYGCGVLAGSKHAMFFRSGTLGFFDFEKNNKTENYGGVRPGCWINTIPAGGLVLVPDASSGCQCSYLNRAWFALEPLGISPPVIKPDGGAFREPVEVTLSSGSADAAIHYTLDGSTPDETSPAYLQPFRLTASASVKARTFADGQSSRTAKSGFQIDPSLLSLSAEKWRVWDVSADAAGRVDAAPSRWTVAGDTVTQSSNIFQGSAGDTSAETERRGTLRIAREFANFTNGQLSFEFNSTDDDGLGVGFRLTDERHHYLWAADRQRGFRILALKNGDDYRVLAQNKLSYQSNTWHTVRVVMHGARLAVFVDGEKDLEIDDESLKQGTVALYSWGTTGVQFRAIRLQPESAATGQ